MSLTTPAGKPAEPAPAAPGFQQRLGLFDATMLIVGTMIGSGIFVTSKAIAADVGSSGWLMAVWGLAGLMTVMGALSYAELAAMMPHAGGQYVYLREAYSPLYGFLYGWTCFLVIQTGSIAAVAVVFAKYLGVLVPQLGTDAILHTVEGVNWQLSLPGMKEPFFEMKDFKISAGQLVAVVVIALLTWLNCRGVQEGKVVQNIFTVAKTLALVALILVGLFLVSNATAREANTADIWGGISRTEAYQRTSDRFGVSGLLAALMVMGGAMVGALFSSDAWNNITFTAGEMRHPRRNLPLSLALGTGGVVTLYLLANLAYLACLPVNPDPAWADRVEQARQNVAAAENAVKQSASAENKMRLLQASDELARADAEGTALRRGISAARDERVGTAVMELWSPGLGTTLMALAIMVSTFGCVNGMTLMGARLYYVMAKDDLFFSGVGTLNARGVPAVGLITQGIWSVLLVFSGTYDDLLDFVIFAVLVFYVLTVAGLFVLRRTRPDAERPYRAIGYPVMPAVYVALCAAVMLNLLFVKPKYTWPGLIIVLTGIPVYFVWRWRSRFAAS